MITFTGVSASPGITVGPVERIDHGTTGLHRIVCDPFRERALYDVAVVLAKDELRRLQQHAQGADADILIFQIALLEDESFTNEIGDYIAAGAGGAAAVERAEQIFAGRLNDVDDEYIRERSVDVCDVCRRVVNILDGRPRRRLHLTRPSILVAEQFFPSDLFSIDRRMVLGLASDQDSTTSHAAIMARNMGLPAVVQLGNGVSRMAAGERAVLDAETGVFIVKPTVAHVAEVDFKMALRRLQGTEPDPVATMPCLTRDGTGFRLYTSAGFARTEDVRAGMQVGSAGVGLLRTEAVMVEAIGEQEQYQGLQALMEATGGAALVVRSCDADADNGAPWVKEVRERMGGHRLYLPQIRAVLRAAAEGPLNLMIPMVRDTEDWDACMAEIQSCVEELKRSGVPHCTKPVVGAVIELPSAALLAEELMQHGAQFLAVDLNDLTRYTCGTERETYTADYRVDAPAVRRLVGQALRAAQGAGGSLYICGLTVAEVPYMPAYLKLGVRSFCIEPSGLLKLKKLLMEQDLREQ